MSFVAVDLGASGSRYVNDSGQIMVVPNNMMLLENGEISRIKPDNNELESCLEVQIVKESGAPCAYFPANVLVGIMAEKESSNNITPNSMTFKANQRINYISTILSCAMARLKLGADEQFDLYMAVPPVQVVNAEENFCPQLPGTYLVTFPKYMGGTEVRFTINTGIVIEEESFMALTSYFFNMNGTVREEAKALMACTTLSLDIGASTSDLAIVKNGRPLDKSGKTVQVGGNIVRDEVIDAVQEKLGYSISPEDADRVVAEGRIQSGMTYIDFSEAVVKAKKKLAVHIVNEIQSHFSKLKMPVSMIHAILVSGGGSLQSQYINEDGEVIKTAEPLSYYVTEALKEYSPNTAVVTYGDSARFANIKGLYIKAKLDSVIKAKKRAAEAQAQAEQAAQAAQAAQAQVQATVPVTPVPVAETPVAPVATPVAPATTVAPTATVAQ